MGKDNDRHSQLDNELAQVYDELYETLITEARDEQVLYDHLQVLRQQEVHDLSDRQIFEHLVASVFSAGFSWDIYKQYEPRLHDVLSDYERTASYDESDVERFLNDDSLLNSQPKFHAMIENAVRFDEIVQQFGSFASYLDSFETEERVLDAMENDFKYIGPETAREFLKEIGYAHFVKLDRHLERVPERIGIVDDGTNREEVVATLEVVAESVDESLSVVDRVFWLHGAGLAEANLDAICGTSPDCSLCRVTDCESRQQTGPQS